ncbi:MAG: sodium:calcium antiporter, partial [Nitrospirae bacterium]|nr:sodium:calcium antiporter [Nitrospirota bacterium]
PDIAVGDVLGSCVFNMFILAFLDVFYRPMPVSTKANQGHVLSAGFGILMLSIIALSLFAQSYVPAILWIGAYSLCTLFIYIIAMRLIFYYEKRQMSKYLEEIATETKYEDVTINNAVMHYGINAFFVIVAAAFLPGLGEGIAEMTGLGQTFVGNIFIAVSTSLPEVVVSIAAIRMGVIDLAVGNLFGSNIFNILILAIDDILFTRSPILSVANPHHIVSAIAAIAMAVIAIIGLTYRAERKPFYFMAWDSLGIATVYIVNLMLLYRMR